MHGGACGQRLADPLVTADATTRGAEHEKEQEQEQAERRAL
ncbi:MAG: hypothetical protein QOD80_1394 [Verrucomicrobiota bacterium]|jgi:hypothetical protein